MRRALRDTAYAPDRGEEQIRLTTIRRDARDKVELSGDTAIPNANIS
jgi:hypothetical protein